jgi:hypothetical protein
LLAVSPSSQSALARAQAVAVGYAVLCRRAAGLAQEEGLAVAPRVVRVVLHVAHRLVAGEL